MKEDFNKKLLEKLPSHIQLKNIVITTGEGDFDNVYKHIKFNILFNKNTEVLEGLLSGLSIQEGQMLFDGEMIVLYQKINGHWKATNYELVRAPIKEQ
ncbi:MAG: hypothetical protein GY820_42790 [Gammaproteobacteria bacterium]|nr:hypothetical protein [Gammaproteobacteria bacterium]